MRVCGNIVYSIRTGVLAVRSNRRCTTGSGAQVYDNMSDEYILQSGRVYIE